MQLPPRLAAATDSYRQSRVGRTLAWYGAMRGSVLCGGIAYSALFSLFAALTIGYTTFTAVLGGDAALRAEVLHQIDDAVPGLIDDGSGGLLQPDALLLSTGLTWAGIIAVVVLLNSALACIAALRSSVRAMFGRASPTENALHGKLRDLGAFVALMVTVVASAAATLAVTRLSRRLLDALGWTDAAPAAITAAGIAVGVVIDALTVVAIVVWLAGVRPGRRSLWIGAAAAAVAFGVLRLLGTEVVARSAGRNALLASFAVIVAVLVLVNLAARILLTACAWMADPPMDDPRTPDIEPEAPGATPPPEPANARTARAPRGARRSA